MAPGSLVDGVVPAGEFWSGSPAERRRVEARGPWQQAPTGRVASTRSAWLGLYGVMAALIAALPGLAVLARRAGPAAGRARRRRPGRRGAPGAAVAPARRARRLRHAARDDLCAGPRSARVGIEPGVHRVRSGTGVRIWSTLRVLDDARTWLFPLYASALTPTWLRMLGARIGPGVEASTVLLIPKFTTVGDHAFLADDTLVGCYELGGGWIRVDPVKIGKRAFVGNSGMAAPGRKVPKESLVAVLSAARRATWPRPARAGWAARRPGCAVRQATTDDTRTYAPPTRLKVARGLVETARVVPLLLLVLLNLAVGVTLLALAMRHPLLAVLLAGPVLIAAGTRRRPRHRRRQVAARRQAPGRRAPAVVVVRLAQRARGHLHRGARRAVVRRAGPGHASPSTSGCGCSAPGSAAACGATPTGCPRPTWSPSTTARPSTAGCVVQTHLFHDRVLSMDTVTLKAGATLGPNSVILPAATIGRHATVGPVSLVMRGEGVPSRTCWIGNPIGPWEAP